MPGGLGGMTVEHEVSTQRFPLTGHEPERAREKR